MFTPIWAILYLKSPYLFPAIASIIFLAGWESRNLNSLVTFPLGIFYTIENLKNGKPPKYPTILILEFARWFLAIGLQNHLAFAGYCYSITISILLEFIGQNERVQLQIKLLFYIIWVLWLLFSPIDLLIHGINFLIDFRLVGGNIKNK